MSFLTALCAGIVLATGCGVDIVYASTDGSVATPITTTIPVTLEFFGMHYFYEYNQPKITYGSRRLWDTGTTWTNIEPARGVYDWSSIDARMASARSSGRPALLELGMTPAWASTHPSVLSSSSGPGALYPPQNIDDWKDYIRTVATRYKGQITAYEVWNEPYAPNYFQGSVADLVKLTAAAYEVIKQVDPNALVVSPSCNTDWLEKFLQAGGGKYIDVVGYHIEASPDAPETVIPLIQQIRGIMQTNGYGKLPLWNTEAWWTKPKVFSSADEAGAYITRFMLLNRAYGVDRVYWYAWDDLRWDTLHLVDASMTPTAAATAFTQVESWMIGSVVQSCTADATSIWTCILLRNGVESKVVWSAAQNGSVATSGFQTQVDLAGGTSKVKGTTLSLGMSPVLLQP